MSSRTRKRDEQDNNTVPPPPSDTNQEEKIEMDSDQPPPQRPRTETTPPPPEVPTPPSGGGLSEVLSRAGVPDASRPPGLRDRENESFSRGVANATFKPKYCDKLTAETVESLTQNRAYALQSGAEKQFPMMNSMSDSVIQTILLLFLQIDKVKHLWTEIGETPRILEPRIYEADLATAVKLFSYEKEILAMLRSYYITATHTGKGQNALQEAKKLVHTSLFLSPARTATLNELASTLCDKRAEHGFTKEQEKEIVDYHHHHFKKLPCDLARRDRVKAELYEKTSTPRLPKHSLNTHNDYSPSQKRLGIGIRWSSMVEAP